MPNGFIEQWGVVAVSGDNQKKDFIIKFVNQPFCIGYPNFSAYFTGTATWQKMPSQVTTDSFNIGAQNNSSVWSAKGF